MYGSIFQFRIEIYMQPFTIINLKMPHFSINMIRQNISLIILILQTVSDFFTINGGNKVLLLDWLHCYIRYHVLFKDLQKLIKYSSILNFSRHVQEACKD